MSRIFAEIQRIEREETTRRPAPGDAEACDLALTSAGIGAVERLECRPGDPLLVRANVDPSALERFRILANRLRQLRHNRRLRTVLIGSGGPEEGKTLVALNLGAALVQNGSRILVIDADLRSPATHTRLGIPGSPGLAEVLEGRRSLASSLRLLEPSRMYYLPAGKPAASPIELLQSKQMRQLLEVAAEHFDWVLLDSAPISLFADTPWLATIADGVLLVVRSGLTQPDSFDETLAALDRAFVAGVVLNADEDRRRNRSYYASGNGKRARGTEAP